MRFHRYFLLVLFVGFYLSGWGISIDKLNQRLKRSLTVEDKVAAYIDLADYYRYNNYDSTIYYADLALPLAISNKDRMSEVDILILKSGILRSQGEFDEAMDMAKLAHEIASRISDRNYFAKTTLCVGTTYLELMVFDIAYTHIVNAIEIFKNNDYEYGLSRGYNVLGVLQGRQNQVDEALESFRKSLTYTNRISDTLFRMTVVSNLGLSYMKRGDYDVAEKIFIDAIDEIERYNIPFSLSKNYLDLSNLYILKDDMNKAVVSCTKALDIAVLQDNKLNIARSCYYLGHIYHDKGDDDKAIEYFGRAYDISDKLYADIKSEVLRYYADIYYAKGDYKKAADYAMEHKRCSDSINKDSNLENLLRLKFEYEYRQQQAEEQFNHKRNTIIYASVVIILLLFLIALWAIYTRQRLKIKNIKLESWNLERELEHRNKEITTKTIYLQQKNDLILGIADKLIKSKYNFKAQNIPLIEDVVAALQSSAKDNTWEEFEMRFENVHVDFFKRLNEAYPNLTQNEKRLCAYLRLNMTTKDIAVLTNTTVSGVEQARFRLRKKFGINSSEIDLNAFIEKL